MPLAHTPYTSMLLLSNSVLLLLAALLCQEVVTKLIHLIPASSLASTDKVSGDIEVVVSTAK